MSDASSFDPKTISNPFYAVSLADYLFASPNPKVSKEDWVLLNANLIEDIGENTWLNEFLDAISQSHEEYDGHDIINPTLTVPLSVRLQGAHQPLIERHEWIAANSKLMKEMGIAKWLEQLLSVLTK